MCQNCSKELAKTYDPKGIEGRLYKKWEDNGYFHAEVDPITLQPCECPKLRGIILFLAHLPFPSKIIAI